MNDTEASDDMKLTGIVQDWLAENEFNAELTVSEDRETSSASVRLMIEEQVFSVFFDANESAETFTIYFYMPVNAPQKRMFEVLQAINRINYRAPRGRLAVGEGDAAGKIQYCWQIDVEGSELTGVQIGNMYHEGARFCQFYFGLLSSLCLTKISFEDAWAQMLEERNKADESDDEGVPDKL